MLYFSSFLWNFHVFLLYITFSTDYFTSDVFVYFPYYEIYPQLHFYIFTFYRILIFSFFLFYSAFRLRLRSLPTSHTVVIPANSPPSSDTLSSVIEIFRPKLRWRPTFSGFPIIILSQVQQQDYRLTLDDFEVGIDSYSIRQVRI